MSSAFLLSGVAAKWTDSLILRGSESTLKAPYKLILARLVSGIAFPLFASMDGVFRSSKASVEWIWNKEACKKDARLAAKCFIGAIASPLSIFSPDIVSFHFIPKVKKPDETRSFGGLYAAKATTVFPASVDELQAVIREAKLSGKKVSIAGAQMSQGKQFLPPGDGGIIINMKRFNSIHFDGTSTSEVTVGAGATWQELQQAANARDLSVQVMQASNVFSIGGSLSVNCHGWDHKAGALGNTIISLTIVNAEGELQVLHPDDELFGYVVGGFGGFGVIVDATITLTQNSMLRRVGEEVRSRHYVDYFRTRIQQNDTVVMHRYLLPLDPKRWSTGIAINFHESTDAGHALAPLVDEPRNGSARDRVYLHLVRRFAVIRKLAWQILKSMNLKSVTESRNESMRPPINAMLNGSRSTQEWLQEYFVGADQLPDFLGFLSAKLGKNSVKLVNASVRYIDEDATSELSYARGEERFSVVLCFTQSLADREVEKTRRWVSEVVDELVRRDGTYYLPYMHFASRAQFRACYPQWRAVADKKNEVDPDNLFTNGLYEEYLLHA